MDPTPMSANRRCVKKKRSVQVEFVVLRALWLTHRDDGMDAAGFAVFADEVEVEVPLHD
jgi:hypothetical protein